MCCRSQRYEEFEMPDQTQAGPMHNLRDVPPPNLGNYVKSEEVAFGEGEGGETVGTVPVPEIERPPLRHIDKYIRPECPCLSKRYTVAVLTCVGKFLIKFLKFFL
jgi:MFS transporter, ACS family, solute carrier family 17 (sodium-dependent inorganic phosphate cotransporter), member 6/7/8